MQPTSVAPFQTGLYHDISDWLAPMDSFADCNNYHVHHGALIKRDGYEKYGQLKKTAATKTITGITNANPGVVTTSTNHGYTTGDRVYIAAVVGMTEVNNIIFTVTVLTPTTFSIVDTTAYGAYGGAGTAALVTDDTDRVMGIYRFLKDDGTYDGLAFSTTRANLFNTGVIQDYEPLDASAIMSGDEYDYIWAHMWQTSGLDNRLYFTNGKTYDGSALDGIRYYSATSLTPSNITTSFTPSLGGANVLYGAKLIFSLRQRLIVLNTHEYNGVSSVNHPQRARWCQAQGPSNWDDTIAGGGGYVDAPTGDQIISAGALRDAIIVFFTDSVWTLRPTADPALPFRWDKINDFRACNGKMATQEYDRYVVAFGFRGITATDGTQTQRIDARIQDFTSDEINAEEFGKVYCQRDYDNTRFWTLYADTIDDENSKALILDDDSKAFTEYQIDMNCLGYGTINRDYALQDFTAANNLDFALEDMGEETLQSYFWNTLQDAFLGGNISGTVYLMNSTTSDDGTNISADVATNMWNPFMKNGQESRLAYVDILVDTDPLTFMKVDFLKDTDTSPYKTQIVDCLPPLGYITSVTNITKANPAQVTAKQHGLSTGDTIYIYGVFGMQEISGQYTITVVDANNFTLDGIDSSAFGTYTYGGSVVRNAFYRTKTWKRAVAGGIGFLHQMKVTSDSPDSPLKIEDFKPEFKQVGKRVIN